VTKPSDSMLSGAIAVTVSAQYSAESEDQFTFKVNSLLLLFAAFFFGDSFSLIASLAIFYFVVLFVC